MTDATHAPRTPATPAPRRLIAGDAYASYDPAAAERAPAIITVTGTYSRAPHHATARREADAIAYALGYTGAGERTRTRGRMADGSFLQAYVFTLSAADVRPGIAVDSDGHPYGLTHYRGKPWNIAR